jgi:hypothetical protein
MKQLSLPQKDEMVPAKHLYRCQHASTIPCNTPRRSRRFFGKARSSHFQCDKTRHQRLLSFPSPTLVARADFGPSFSRPARTSIQTLEDNFPDHGAMIEDTFRVHFTKTHLALFHNNRSEGHTYASDFASSFKLHANSSHVRLGEDSTYIAIINIAALFDYGNEAPMRYIFDVANHLSSSSTSSASDEELPESLKDPIFADLEDVECHIAKCDLLLNTFETVLTLQTVISTSSHVLTVMAFLLSLARAIKVTSAQFSSAVFDSHLVFERVPWKSLCNYLNGSNFDGVRENLCATFPQSEDAQRRQLPEDYLVRGLVWTYSYFPSDWFETNRDREEDSIESAINFGPQVERIAWLAHRLCSV